MFFHAGKLQGGFLGVDLFFALSGFLITSLLLAEVDLRGSVDVVKFWGRRFRRLLPAVLVLLVAVTILATIFATIPERAATIEDGPWAQIYLANWHSIAQHRDYWASFELPRMFGHLWSLAIEEQFYVLWPVVVGFIAWRSRNAHRTIIISCIVASVLSLALMIALFDPSDPTRVYIGTDTRVSSLLLGALFAAAPMRAIVSRTSDRLGGMFAVVAFAIAGVIGLSWFLIDGPSSPWLFRGGLFVHSLLSAVLVAACFARPKSTTSRWLGWEPLRVVGVMSYSLYLWHWPVFDLLSPVRTGMSGWPLLILRFAVAFAAAAISKVLIEDPIRFRARWARGRQGLVALIAASTVVGVFWLVVPLPDTAPAAFSLDQFASTTAAVPTTVDPTSVVPSTVAANTATTVSPATTIPATTTTVAPLLAPTSRVLMVGDSMAFDEWPAVASALYAGKIAIAGYVSPGAGSARHEVRLDDRDRQDGARLQARPRACTRARCGTSARPTFNALAYERFTDVVLGQGARLAFVTIPPLRADHQDPANLGALTGIMGDIADEHPGQVIVLDSDEVWGPVFEQDVNGDKVPERKPDGVHVCPSGAAMYALWLTDQLQQRFADFVPAPLADWANADWVNDPRYTQPEGICAALP